MCSVIYYLYSSYVGLPSSVSLSVRVGYIAAKCNIFANQHATDRLVLNYDNEITRNIGQTATEAVEPHPPLWFSRTQTPPQNGQPAILLQNGDIVV